MWLRQRSGAAHIACPCRRYLFHRVMFFGSCPSAKNGRGDKDMATTDVGQTGQHGDTGRWVSSCIFNRTINVRIISILFCAFFIWLVMCMFRAHLYCTCMHVMFVSA